MGEQRDGSRGGLGAPRGGLAQGQALRLALLCLLVTVGVAFDADDLGMMDESVDESDDARCVRKDGAPLGEGLVGGDDDRLVCV